MASRRIRRALYVLAQLTWGLPQTLVGALVCLVCIARGRRTAPFHGALSCTWGLDAGLSLGLFVFVPERCPRRLLAHEFGHTIQSLVAGPLYLPVFALPSMVWAGLPCLRRMRFDRGIDYYSFYTERVADRLVERVLGEPGMGAPGAGPRRPGAAARRAASKARVPKY